MSSISSKNRTNKFDFTTMILVFVCFLEEIKDIKKQFRNYLTFNPMQISNLILIISLTFKGLTPILGSAAASCTRRQSCTEDEDEANTDDQMTEDSHADDLTVPPPPSPPCTCGKNLELPPTPPLDDLEAAAKNLTYSQQGRTISYCLLPFSHLLKP